MRRIRYALLITLALVIVSFSGVPSVHGFMESESLVSGPYVDEVIYKIIANRDQRFLALQAGEIEMDHSFFDPVYFETLSTSISDYE